MKYHIISNASLTHVEDGVNEYLKSGWTLQGGVSFAMGLYGQVYSQAMVFKEPETNNTGPR